MDMWQAGARGEYHNWGLRGRTVHQIVVDAITEREYDTDFGPEFEVVYTLIDIDSGEIFVDTNEYLFPID